LRNGELPPGLEVTELGELTTGKKPGRENAGEITVCDLTGTGVQDTAIANLAYVEAARRGMGLVIAE
jgi:ornithine cyclodeaminase